MTDQNKKTPPNKRELAVQRTLEDLGAVVKMIPQLEKSGANTRTIALAAKQMRHRAESLLKRCETRGHYRKEGEKAAKQAAEKAAAADKLNEIHEKNQVEIIELRGQIEDFTAQLDEDMKSQAAELAEAEALVEAESDEKKKAQMQKDIDKMASDHATSNGLAQEQIKGLNNKIVHIELDEEELRNELSDQEDIV